jgi:(p)ppGpp synthase/HD superfamily hydrolase
MPRRRRRGILVVMSPPPWSPDLYLRAARFAAAAHHGQKLPGSELPYFVHVAQVAAEVMAGLAVEPAERPDLALACALLHDVVEDTRTGLADIEAAFGRDVAAGVSALSKDPALPKDQAMADSLRRIRDQPREVWRVKLADRIVNLEPPPHYWKEAKIAAYREEAARIADVLGDASPYLHARLRARIAGYPHNV